MKKITSLLTIITATQLHCAALSSFFQSDLEKKLSHCPCLGIGMVESDIVENFPKAARTIAEEKAKLDYLTRCRARESGPAYIGERLMFYDADRGIAYACNSYYIQGSEKTTSDILEGK